MEGPFIPLSQQIVKMHLAEHNLAIEKAKVLILEMTERKLKNNENIVKTQEEIDLLELKDEPFLIANQKKKMHIAAQKATIERQIFENMEADQRIEKAQQTILNHEKAFNECTETLKDLIKAHKDLTLNYFKENSLNNSKENLKYFKII